MLFKFRIINARLLERLSNVRLITMFEHESKEVREGHCVVTSTFARANQRDPVVAVSTR